MNIDFNIEIDQSEYLVSVESSNQKMLPLFQFERFKARGLDKQASSSLIEHLLILAWW